MNRRPQHYEIDLSPREINGNEFWYAEITSGEKTAGAVDQDPQRAIEQAWQRLDHTWIFRT